MAAGAPPDPFLQPQAWLAEKEQWVMDSLALVFSGIEIVLLACFVILLIACGSRFGLIRSEGLRRFLTDPITRVGRRVTRANARRVEQAPELHEGDAG